ncbi:hypothetical protein WR25_17332 [Diploscapter pachys]|uniref:Uncharacterized protein n=1 Tax=Diploscapter pachys TaxID=2018661 RepID=A0A2A2JNK2_9BILA|nr:hypothetical protein WR25_17332 [Diploscapter pachys]
MQQFYRGEIANKIVEEMRIQEGLITKADLVNYDARLESPLELQVCNDFIIKGPRAPSILPLLLAAVKTLCEKYQNMNNLDQNEAYFDDILKTQNILGDYLLDIGDPHFDFETNELQESLMQGNLSQILLERLNSLENQKDSTQKTDQLNLASEFLNVVDLEGNIVSYSASLTNKRGSLKRSKQYGFFWNNAMSAFNSNGGKDIINTIQGKKRPRTSLMPMMLVNRRTHVKDQELL